MTARYLAVALLIGMVAGCDSQTGLTSMRTPVSNINATETITAIGSTTAIAYLFNQSDIPASVRTGSNLQVVLGGRPAALSTFVNPKAPTVALYQAALPPQTPPPSVDLNGNVNLLFQSTSGSQYVTTHITVAPPVVIAPATASI